MSNHWKGGCDKKAITKKWQLNNKVRFQQLIRNRDKRLKGLEHHTYGEWEALKAKYSFTCPACRRKEPSIKLTRDHIMPLSVGGKDTIDNIQPLCGSCNSRKHTANYQYLERFL